MLFTTALLKIKGVNKQLPVEVSLRIKGVNKQLPVEVSLRIKGVNKQLPVEVSLRIKGVINTVKGIIKVPETHPTSMVFQDKMIPLRCL